MARPRGLPLLPFAATALAVALLDCGKGGKPMTTVMQFMESHYRDIEAGRERLAPGGPESSREAEFRRVAERATKIAELSEEPLYASYRAAPDFQGWRASLRARALEIAEAARREDGAAVEAGYVAVSEVMTSCHRRYPLSPRQATPRPK